MQKVFNIAVDIRSKIPAPAFEVNTNDLKSVKLEITITNGQSLLDLTNVTPRIGIRKPDNEVIFQDCEIVDAKAGKVQIVLENQAYLAPGTHTAEIMCYKGSDVVAVTGTFSYKSTKGIMNDKAIESKSEFTAIDRKLIEVQEILEDARENGTGVDAQARKDLQNVSAQITELEGQKVDEVVSNGRVLTFKANGSVIGSYDLSAVANTEAVQSYVNTLVSNGTIAAATVGEKSVTPTKTSFLELDTRQNLFDGNYSSIRITGSPDYKLEAGTAGTHKTAIVPIKPNTKYSIIKKPSDMFKTATDTIHNRPIGQLTNGAIKRNTDKPTQDVTYTFTSGPNDVVLYVYATYTGQDVFMQIVEGTQTNFTITDYPIKPKNVSIYSKQEVDEKLANNVSSKVFVRKTGEIFSIYIPTKNNRYVKYTYEHIVKTDISYDSWRIKELSIVDVNFSPMWVLAPDIEIEGAVEEVGAPDFVGGFHGDEYLLDLSILLDGIDISPNAADFERYVDEIKIINRSYLNRADTTTKIFTRYRVNTWNKEKGLIVENKYIVEAPVNINKTHLTMMAINKTYNGKQQVKWARTNYNFEKVDVSIPFSGTSITPKRKDITYMEIWGEESQLYARIESVYDKSKYPNHGAWMYDFGDRPKAYFDVTGQTSLKAGDVIECKSIYTIY